MGLVHPVIDCIPALLRARGLQVVPLSERVLRTGDPFAAHPGLEAVRGGQPEQPDRDGPERAGLERLARACAARVLRS